MPYTIAIDPGHGGSDYGVIGIMEEVSIVNGVSKYLHQLLSHDNNFSVHLTRPLDLAKLEGTVSIKVRSAIANEHDSDMLISLHTSPSDSSISLGVACYPKVPGTKYHEESKTIAHLIVGALFGIQPDVIGSNGVRYRYYNSGEYANSGDKNENADETYHGIVRLPSCPAVLVELCYTNTPADVYKFDSEAKWRQTSVCIYYALCRYFNTKPVFNPVGMYHGSDGASPCITGVHDLAVDGIHKYKISNYSTGLNLCLFGGKIATLNNVVQWEDSTNANQSWLLQSNENGTYLSTCCNTEFVLDAYLPNEYGCNAGIWKNNDPIAQILLISQYNDRYKVNLRAFPFLALTAIGNENGSLRGQYSFSPGNVFWDLDTHQDTQLWNFKCT